MGRMIDHAVAGAGLEDLRAGLARRIAAGGGLTAAERTLLQGADVLVVGALADEVRAALCGDRVLMVEAAAARGRTDWELPALGGGIDGLRALAMARLGTARSIAVDVERIGLHVAQVALGFGADVWIVPPGARRSLTGMSVDLEALVRRAGRIPQWVKTGAAAELVEVAK